MYLEPREPIELEQLTAAFGSLSRQYQSFAVEAGLVGKSAQAKLLVSAVSPGSIDIHLVPDLAGLAATTGPLFLPLIDKLELLTNFAKRIKAIIDFFIGEDGDRAPADLTIKDCDDATNIVKPIADHGGSQTFNVINGPTTINILTTNTLQARKAIEGATRKRASLAPGRLQPENRQRVAMMWSRLDRDEAKVEGRSPDRGLIEEIDPKPHAVLFTDDLSYLKREMVADEENPLQQIYFVDVEISRAAGGKVAAYRITGYHGKEDLTPDE